MARDSVDCETCYYREETTCNHPNEVVHPRERLRNWMHFAALAPVRFRPTAPDWCPQRWKQGELPWQRTTKDATG